VFWLSGIIASSTEGSALVGLGIAAFVGAGFATGWILLFAHNKQSVAGELSKRKNNPAYDADPMALLTDEDIAELRAEYKDVLRRRMLEDGAAEIESFDDLLSDSKRSRR
jgi:hypothetical protein